MVRFVTVFLLSFLIGISASANQITEQQARQIAAKYADIDVNANPQRMKAAGNRQEAAAYYAFNIGDNEGFVIVSGDDSLTELVGYSDSGSFDSENIPDNMRSWLQTYSGYVKSVQSSGCKTDRKEIKRAAPVVKPLISTMWGQGDPFNMLAPEYSYGKHCVAGCVATAMAQLLNYYEWPDCGAGSHGYTHDVYGELYVDFSQSEYDWENMLDDYYPYTVAQAEAVAKLVYDCGISVEMNYGEGASGAPVRNITPALIEYFKYYSDTHYRDNISSDDFMRIVFDELDNGHPILFGGETLEVGHIFVVDGYDSNGFVHVNWGWEGYFDGYFNVNYMAPYEDHAYNYYQYVITARPNTTGVLPDREQLRLGYYSYEQSEYGVLMDDAGFAQDDMQPVALMNVMNYDIADFKGEINVGLFDENDLLVKPISSPVPLELPHGYYWDEPIEFIADFRDVPDGHYKVCGISREESLDNEYEWIKFESRFFVEVEITDGYVAINPQESSLTLNRPVEKQGKIYMNSSAKFAVSIHNDSEITVNGQINYEVRRERDGAVLYAASLQAIIYDDNDYEMVLEVPINSDDFNKSDSYVFAVTGLQPKYGDLFVFDPEMSECAFTIDEGFQQKILVLDYLRISELNFKKTERQTMTLEAAASMDSGYAGRISVAVCDDDNLLTVSDDAEMVETEYGWFGNIKVNSPDMSGLADGLYSLIPVSCQSGAAEWVPFDYSLRIYLEIEGDDVTVFSLSQDDEVSMDGEEIEVGDIANLKLPLHNSSRFDANGELCYLVSDAEEGDVLFVGYADVDVRANSSADIALDFTLDPNLFENGKAYEVFLSWYLSYTDYDYVLSSAYPNFVFTIGSSGIDDIETDRLSVYPNPTSNYITVDCDERINRVAIFSASGQLVKSVAGTDAEGSIHVGDLPIGYYIVAVETESGATVRRQILKR